MLLEHICDVKRYQSVGTNGRKQLATVAATRPCLILPLSPAAAIQNGFSIGQAFKATFGEGEDIREGDKLVSDGRTYLVKGVRVYKLPIISHVRALCTQEAS